MTANGWIITACIAAFTAMLAGISLYGEVERYRAGRPYAWHRLVRWLDERLPK